MIFGHFIYFGHFPIEIPIEAEKYYHHGKELSYRENKMCSETSEAVGTIWEHAEKEFQKFLKIRITLLAWLERVRADQQMKALVPDAGAVDWVPPVRHKIIYSSRLR